MTEFSGHIQQILSENGQVLQRVDPLEIDKLVSGILHSRRLFLDGRGRSGMMMRAFAIRLTHLDIHCHVVGESTTPSLRPGDLLLVGSGSGETITPILTAKIAREAGGSVAVLTSRRESTLAQMADQTVIVPAPVREESEVKPVQTAQPMASLFEQSLLLVLDAIVLLLMARLRQNDQMMMTRHSNLE